METAKLDCAVIYRGKAYGICRPCYWELQQIDERHRAYQMPGTTEGCEIRALIEAHPVGSAKRQKMEGVWSFLRPFNSQEESTSHG